MVEVYRALTMCPVLAKPLLTPMRSPLASGTETVGISPFDRQGARGSEWQKHRLNVWAARAVPEEGQEVPPSFPLPKLLAVGGPAPFSPAIATSSLSAFIANARRHACRVLSGE